MLYRIFQLESISSTYCLTALLATMMLASTVLHAQSEAIGSVHGRVVDQDGQPIESASVVIIGTQLASSSGSEGAFELAGVMVGRHTLEASRHAFATATAVDVDVRAGASTEVIFQLTALPQTLKEVVVTASFSLLEEEPTSGFGLDRAEISTLPHFGDDLYRAITVLPSISSGDISGRFSVRGGLHDEILVQLDQIELYEPFHLKDFQGVFTILDPEAIGGVELTPSGFAAPYGDRMTAVLDMRTRKPSTTRTSLGISFTNAWFTSHGTFAEDRGQWLASLRRGYLDVVLNMVADSEDDDLPDPQYWDAFGKLSYRLSPSNAMTFSFLAADDSLLYEEQDEDEFGDIDTGYGSAYVWLTHQGVLGTRSFVDTTAYASRITADRNALWIEEDEGFDIHDDRSTDVVGIRQAWEAEIHSRHYLRWGFDVRQYDTTFDYRNTVERQDPIDDPRFPAGITVTRFADTFTSDLYGVYLTDRIRLAEILTAELGVRWDHLALTDESQTSPRVNLRLDLGLGSALRAGWGHYYQSQRSQELAVQYGETELQPAQRAEHFTLGFETAAVSSILIRADAYHRKVRDPWRRYETLFDPFHPLPEIASDLIRIEPESVSATGVELHLSSTNGGKLSWWASYTYSTIEDHVAGEDVFRYVDQTHAVTALITWRPNHKWTLTAVGTYHTGWPATSVVGERIMHPDGSSELHYEIGRFYGERHSAYQRIDIRASKTAQLKKSELTFFIDVQNLFDRDNARGVEIDDPDYHQENDRLLATFPSSSWLGILPSVGVSWTF